MREIMHKYLALALDQRSKLIHIKISLHLVYEKHSIAYRDKNTCYFAKLSVFCLRRIHMPALIFSTCVVHLIISLHFKIVWPSIFFGKFTRKLV